MSKAPLTVLLIFNFALKEREHLLKALKLLRPASLKPHLYARMRANVAYNALNLQGSDVRQARLAEAIAPWDACAAAAECVRSSQMAL